ncbi:MAG: tRNA 2-selenouridine(34) synthase MnmH [Cyclobacteriaceae bacterium]|nr:tRNA 2-selenouridine(34) synthase MnmH [Cyclobacteriaceae bacterium]MCB0499492.1 tRNA 2-selenouridine(34) synthase MnmH [Cyclobacteriaceae bacterium]MCB9238073.1 tRNA 2-selenouridine(34) synthase MnmH [Flammeovirgaceae bacterium]MCO5272535.1 tRNA 2-selenouridine(34) synthase MnmH [Cyclobacteriaceae bacterium]MCW5901603.1 tRNA 2-selenouridine(34) synthase MnmH [Cyclobacteriaceae bacterium]
MIRQIGWDDFLNLRATLPVADVRSPLEYAAGHMPGAKNIPLLNNEERMAVGTDYKEKGQREAIRTGFGKVGPRLNEIVEAAEKEAKANELIAHCWRGGMRSSFFGQFVGMVGINTFLLKGGYKTYRQQAQVFFDRPYQTILLSGCTGSGKTELLRGLKAQGEQVVDLEGMANHKGSAFGGLMMPPQPTTEQFENDLFERLREFDINKPIWIEDESIAVGKIFLPRGFWATMRRSPVVLMEVEKEVRVQRLVNEYGHADRGQFLGSMKKITKKLGGQHFKDASGKLDRNEMGAVMEILLTYYDKAYLGSLEKRKPSVLEKLKWDGADPSTAVRQLIEISRQRTVS